MIPAAAKRAEVRLFYQSTSKESVQPADAIQDADKDGLNNLTESALGSSPTDAASTHWPHGAWVVVGEPPGRHLALSYVRRKSLQAADIIVEVSNDLATWHSCPAYTKTDSTTPRNDETETVIERMVAPVAGAFMRLRIQPKPTNPQPP